MPVSALGYGAGTSEIAASRARASDEAREAKQSKQSSAPDLAQASASNAAQLFGALAPNATEAKRLNDLVASAKAAAVQVVTQPIEAASGESVRSVSELLDRVGFRTPAYEAAAAYAATDSRVKTPNAPVQQNPAAAAPLQPELVDETPSQPVEAAAPAPVEETPTAAPIETAPAAPSEPEDSAQPATPPAATAPTPAPEPDPAPAAPAQTTPSSGSASTSPSNGSSSTTPAQPAPSQPAPASSSNSGGWLGSLFGRR